jgi:predicted O-methyltransferase YrrM
MPAITSIKTTDFGAIAGTIVASVGLAMIGGRLLGASALLAYLLLLSLSAFAFIAVVLHRRLAVILDTQRRRIEAGQWEHYRQLEALLTVVTSVAPACPLQETRKWAASPDFLRLVVQTVLTKSPSLVVEAGSGVSTIIIGLCLRKLGKGRLVSLDHEAQFAEATRRQVSIHGLDDIVTVTHAPLVEGTIGEERWRWYQTDDASEPIDVLVIDGPPSSTQPLARYPAVPLLGTRLKAGSVILLDDGARPDEKSAVDRWIKENPHATAQFVGLEKGAFVVSWGDIEKADR